MPWNYAHRTRLEGSDAKTFIDESPTTLFAMRERCTRVVRLAPLPERLSAQLPEGFAKNKVGSVTIPLLAQRIGE